MPAGHADAYGPDDALSRSRMLAIAKEHLPLPDLHRLDANTAAAIKRADAMTAWRIEGTLREFARFDPSTSGSTIPYTSWTAACWRTCSQKAITSSLAPAVPQSAGETKILPPKASVPNCAPPLKPAPWMVK